MSRLALLALTLTALPLSGESFVSTIASSTTTTTESNLPQSHKTGYCQQRSVQRIRGRPYTRRQQQRQHQHQQPAAQDQRPSFSSPFVSSVISYRRSHSLLNAALLNDSSSSEQGKRSGRGTDKKAPGWRRRILGKISRRRQLQGRHGGSESSSSLPFSAIEQEEGQTGTVESFVVYNQEMQDGNDAFIARNFDSLVPDAVLPVVQLDQKKSSPVPHSLSQEVDSKVHGSSKPPIIDSEYFDVSITPAKPNTGAVKKISSAPEPAATSTSTTPANTKKGLVCRLLENVLTERIGQRWTTETPTNLKVDISSSIDKYNNIGRLLFKGLYRADATLSSDRIVFPNIRFSSVRLQMEKVTLNLMGFYENHSQFKREMQKQRQGNQDQVGRQINTFSPSTSTKATGKARYPKQFDLHIEDLTMSRHDLLFSPCIKNGLRQLLINVLKDRGVRSDSIRITSIDILRNGKISCIGEAKTHFASAPPVHFEVRSGISFGKRGHVLTFPGLEVALNRDIGLFVPVHPTLDLDVGHNMKFRNIVIDGRQKLLKIAASVTITPDRTRLTQDYVQMGDAFSALFFYDVGQWLTRLGRFSK